MKTLTKHTMYVAALVGLLFVVSCSNDEEPTPAPTNGQVAVTVNDPDGVAAAGVQIRFFATEADANENQNVIQSFSGNAQGVVDIDIEFGSYFVRIISSDDLLLDATSQVTIAETNAPETVTLGWDAEAFVVGTWNMTAYSAVTTVDGTAFEDTDYEGGGLSFLANGSYTLLSGGQELLSDDWLIDSEESLIRLGGTKQVLEAYAAALEQVVTVPDADVPDVETYAVTTYSRNNVVLLSSGSIAIDGVSVEYAYRLTLIRG